MKRIRFIRGINRYDFFYVPTIRQSNNGLFSMLTIEWLNLYIGFAKDWVKGEMLMNMFLFVILVLYLWGVHKYDKGETASALNIFSRGLAISLGLLTAVIMVIV